MTGHETQAHNLDQLIWLPVHTSFLLSLQPISTFIYCVSEFKAQCVEIRMIYWQTLNIIPVTMLKFVCKCVKFKSAFMWPLNNHFYIDVSMSPFYRGHHLAPQCCYGSPEWKMGLETVFCILIEQPPSNKEEKEGGGVCC